MSKIRLKVTEVGETFQVGENNLDKRFLEAIIEGEFPQTFQFEFIGDKTELLNDVKEGPYLTIHYNLRSRKVTEDKDGNPLEEPLFFTSLQGWKVEE
jgi:hypothetical protein